MGTPSETEPWGWQLDGHHLIINYFVLGDQVVMTPTFMGSEPVTATSGTYTGTTVLQDEQHKGLALINALDDAQRQKAIIQVAKAGNNNVGEAFKDNVILDYAGIRAAELTATQQAQLLDLIGAVCAEPARRARAGEDGRGAAACGRDPLRLDRRDRAGQRLLLPHPQPSALDRVRSSDPDRPAASGTWEAHPRAHSHRGADAKRERLWEGSAPTALPAASAPAQALNGFPYWAFSDG